MKKNVFGAAACLALAAGIVCTACGPSAKDFEYTVSPERTVAITGYKSTAAKVSIPAKIEGMSVTVIDNGAFKEKALTRVTIPKSVTYIGNRACEGCTSLTSVTLPGSVTSIVGYAFWCLSTLPRVTIPGSVAGIGGYYTFNECTSLDEASKKAIRAAGYNGSF
jgi:putative transposon-encoded protein